MGVINNTPSCDCDVMLNSYIQCFITLTPRKLIPTGVNLTPAQFLQYITVFQTLKEVFEFFKTKKIKVSYFDTKFEHQNVECPFSLQMTRSNTIVGLT